MRRNRPPHKQSFFIFLYRCVASFSDPVKSLNAARKFPSFVKDLILYSRMDPIKLMDLYPCLHEKTQTTSFDAHYFYQNAWVMRRIKENCPNHHVDVGSSIDFVAMLSALTKVTFIDIRPLQAHLKNLVCIQGNILSLPFKECSIDSLSCLHVAEHIGLGRYGERLDPEGTQKAARELARVLGLKGNLYFSLPVGHSRVCFNAHRIHSPCQVLDLFAPLHLMEFSVVDDDRLFCENTNPELYGHLQYGCGLFWFKKF